MAGGPWFPWLIAGAFAVCIGMQLRTQEIRMWGKIGSWARVKASDDPRRFWLFVIAETIALLAVIADGVGVIH